MRSMMLHGAATRNRQSRSMHSRRILRMTVMRDHEIIPSDVVHRDQVGHRFFKGAGGLVVNQISYVLAYKCLPIDDKSDGVFEIRTQGKHWLFNSQFCNCSGGIAA